MSSREFRLAILLRLRETARDQCRQDLAQAILAEESLVLQQRRVQEERNAVREFARSSSTPGAIHLERLRDFQRCDVALMSEQERLAANRVLAGEESEQRRLALVEANRQVRTLELLRDRHRQAFCDEENRRVSRSLDEAAQVAYFRRTSNNQPSIDTLDAG